MAQKVMENTENHFKPMRPEQNEIISQHATSVCMVTAAFYAMSLVFATLKTLICF